MEQISIFLTQSIQKKIFTLKVIVLKMKKRIFIDVLLVQVIFHYSAFQQSHELNIEISNILLFGDYKQKILNILNSPFLYELNEKIIARICKYLYDEKDNFIKKLEEKSSAQLNVIKFEGPNSKVHVSAKLTY